MNPLLQKVIDHTDQTAKNKDAYQRIVMAGMKVMFSPNTHAILMEGIDQAPDLAEWAGKGVVGILAMMAKKSRGTMPFDSSLPAGVTLLMHGLDALEQAGKIQVTDELIGNATKAYSTGMLHIAGVGEKQLAKMTADAKTHMENPAIAAKMKEMNHGAN